jgi:ATP-binding cassette subfamily B protein/subfamily B ATP-binding cassette protein MsbA
MAIAALTAITSAVAALQPWPIKVLVDYGINDLSPPSIVRVPLEAVGLSTSAATMIVVAAALSIALFLFNSALTVGLSISWSMAGQRMVYDIAGDVFARLQRLSLLFHTRRSVGDSLSRLMEDTWCIYSLADGLLMAPIQHMLTLGMMIWIGYFLDPVLATLAIVVAPLLAASSWYFGPRLKRRSHLLRAARSRLLSLVHQTLGALPVVQAFRTADRNDAQFSKLAHETVVLEQRGNLMGSMYGLINGLVTSGGLALVLYVGGMRVVSGTIPLGTLLVFIAYVRQMQGATSGLFEVFTKVKAAQASIERLQDILKSEEIVREVPNARSLPSRSASRRGEIRFEKVSFGYEPGRTILESVTLTAHPGEMIALVGPTGAGKSTLVSLIPRFFDPWQGQVLFDGINVRDLKLASLREAISIVLQEPFLLPLSIAENIAYGRPDAGRQAIVAAAVAAQADGFISSLPEGYDTLVGETGASLSVGEQQRISIARALLKDAPVLILDEPTSALDAQTESALMVALEQLTKDRTTFTIAHRMSTIRRADRIAVIERGRVVAFGDHDELIEAGGVYEQFVRQQLSYGMAKVVA